MKALGALCIALVLSALLGFAYISVHQHMDGLWVHVFFAVLYIAAGFGSAAIAMDEEDEDE